MADAANSLLYFIIPHFNQLNMAFQLLSTYLVALIKFLSVGCFAQTQIFHTSTEWALSTASYSAWPYMEHTFSSIIHNLGGMLNNWSELGGLSAQRSFACSWWICGIQCTLQGERGNIVLSCVSVFTAHSLINYSAGPSDCDLQFWEEARVFPA